MFDENVDDNNKPHTNKEYRRYQAWYHQATRSRLKLQWTHDDYANIESSKDEDTTYDHSTHVGRQVGVGPLYSCRSPGGSKTDLGQIYHVHMPCNVLVVRSNYLRHVRFSPEHMCPSLVQVLTCHVLCYVC
jgi:hypothetical protein